MQNNEKSILVLLLKLSRNVTNTFEKEFGITYARMRILIRLHKKGEMSQTDLQNHLEIDPAAVCRQLKLLKEQGLLESKIKSSDARCVFLNLTTKGTHAAINCIEKRKKLEQEVLLNISNENLVLFRDVLNSLQLVFTHRKTEGE